MFVDGVDKLVQSVYCWKQHATQRKEVTVVITESRHDVKLLSSDMLAQLMEHNGYTVRSLAEAATRELRKARYGMVCGRGTVGNLRSGYRNTCNPKTAWAIAKCLNVPVGALFQTRVSNVQRETHRTAA